MASLMFVLKWIAVLFIIIILYIPLETTDDKGSLHAKYCGRYIEF